MITLRFILIECNYFGCLSPFIVHYLSNDFQTLGVKKKSQTVAQTGAFLSKFYFERVHFIVTKDGL